MLAVFSEPFPSWRRSSTYLLCAAIMGDFRPRYHSLALVGRLRGSEHLSSAGQARGVRPEIADDLLMPPQDSQGHQASASRDEPNHTTGASEHDIQLRDRGPICVTDSGVESSQGVPRLGNLEQLSAHMATDSGPGRGFADNMTDRTTKPANFNCLQSV